jgi:hypothetical protein
LSLLLSYLSTIDARCPGCGYALRGCTSEQCPECGRGLHLALGAESRLRPLWLMSMFGPAVCVALSAWLLKPLLGPLQSATAIPRQTIVLTGAGLMPRTPPPSWNGLVLGLLLLLASGALLALAVGGRRRLSQMAPAPRLALALSLFVSPLLLLGLVRLYVALSA